MQTEREYLVGLGLAKPTKGRFSREAKEALANAKAGGMEFKSTVPEKNSKPRSVKVVKPKRTESVNPAHVRKWAKDNGHEVSERGRVREDIIALYLENVDAEDRKANEADGGVNDFRPEYRRYSNETTFSGEDSEGKTHTVNGAQACSCGYSLVGHICEMPSALVNTKSNGLERIRVYPDGRN